jgi:hypothetical protein
MVYQLRRKVERMSETRATYRTTQERYLIYRETLCQACNGDGWRIVDEEAPGCTECDGTGRKLEEIAALPSLKEIEAFLPDRIPFQGEALYPKVCSEFEEYF